MSEQEIDRVLQGLGGAEPREGMERRILARLEAEELAGAWWSRPRWAAMGGVVLAGVTVLAVMLPLVHRGRVGVSLQGALPEVTRAPGLKPFAGEAEMGGVEAPRTLRNDEEQTTRQVAVSRAPAVRVDSHMAGREAAAVQEADWSVGNHPAPPMPLTEQEKMLLRLAHHSDPAELAKLNSAALEAQSAAEMAEFKEFFVQPDFLVKPKMENNQ